jgi:hypothetical protein
MLLSEDSKWEGRSHCAGETEAAVAPAGSGDTGRRSPAPAGVGTRAPAGIPNIGMT